MAGPALLVGVLAAAMIVISACCASRLVISRLRQRETEADADGIHVVMGVSMAGMLAPRLSFLPGTVWEVVFGAAATWFAWQAVQARRVRGRPRCWRCPDPAPHAIECGAMIFMFLAVPGPVRDGATGMQMAGMHGLAGAAWSFPVLAVVLAMFMLGYVLWTTDRLTSLAHAHIAINAPTMTRSDARFPVLAGGSAGGTSKPADSLGMPDPTGPRRRHPGDRPMLAPRLAAGYKIAMGIAMSYMLIMMI